MHDHGGHPPARRSQCGELHGGHRRRGRAWCRTRIIRDFARTFDGVEHRIELVRTYHGVRYYNDSIASSPSRTIAGLRSFPEQVILIAGGYDKHIPFDVLGPEIVEHVKLLVLCGATAGKIRAAVEQAPGYRPGHPEILEVTPFQRAVEAARDRAQPRRRGDAVPGLRRLRPVQKLHGARQDLQGHRQRLAGVSTPPPLPAYTGAGEVRAVKRLRYVRLSAGRRAADLRAFSCWRR